MVSVTTGHGTSLMAPSIIRKIMTSALRMRPVQRAGFETGAVAVIVIMVFSRRLEWLLGFKTKERSGNRQSERNFFRHGRASRGHPRLVYVRGQQVVADRVVPGRTG